MASKGQDKTKSSAHGVKIDSKLIPKASSDTQSELSGLGVSVYNQEEFEAGVLHQIDREVQRRNAEQAKAFLVKDYNSVQSELKSVHVELKNISKTIAGLLSQPLCNVVLKLRELRASQEAKRKQILSLEAREHNLLKRLSGRNTDEVEPLQSSTSRSGLNEQPDNDNVGSLSSVLEGDWSSERQRLIQTGQITPFDTSTQLLDHSLKLTTTEINSTLPSPLSPSATLFTPSTDHSVSGDNSLPLSTSQTSNSQTLTDRQVGRRLDNVTISSLAGSSNSDSTPAWGVKRKRSSPTLQLSTDSFDGLFSDPSPTTLPKTKKGKRISRIGKSRKGKDKAQSESIDSNFYHTPSQSDNSSISSSQSIVVTGDTLQAAPELNFHGADNSKSSSSHDSSPLDTSQLPSTHSLESLCPSSASLEDPTLILEGSSTEVIKDQSLLSNSPNKEDTNADNWVPSLADFENFDSEDSYESEYYTDEELGGVNGRRPKKKVTLRPLSGDELESDDVDDHVTSRKRKKGRGSKKRKKFCGISMKQRKHLDDGDEQLYRMRRSELREESPGETDKVFEGGLRIPGSIWNRLYRYQQTGVKWLWELHCQQAGGIVGDEMGLGKTIQMIAFLAGLKVSNLRSHTTRELGLGPCLIVCPATVMHQWVSEFHIWWSTFRVAVLHDTGTFSGDKRLLVDQIVQESAVLVTTYAGVRIYQDLLLRHKWDYVILDEGHKIRNPDAEITLACKQFPTPHRIILSGSPMQNNLRELWSLFDFVFPGKLGTLPIFLEQFSVPITLGGYVNATEVQVKSAYKCACVLRDTINPYLLRRLKANVKIQLPDKNEQVLFCRLTDYQHDLYDDFLKGPEVERALAGRKQIFSALATLRKLCNHPDLITNEFSEQVTFGKGEKGGSKERVKTGPSSNGLDYLKQIKSKRKFTGSSVEGLSSTSRNGEEVYGYYKRSGKMIVVQSLLKLWQEQGHRVLLFSQSKLMLDILEIFVAEQGYTYQRMDGGTQISTRQPLINKFNEDPSIFVFLLTTRVGGLGVNLTGANRIIIYDPDWNPSTDTQARERAWRIGQKRQVTVYRLLTSGTIEEKIYHRQIFKQFLTNRVLKDPRQRRFFKSNDVYDLFTLDPNSRDGSTETSAIFAGTGSEVSLKKRKKEQTTSKEATQVREKRKKKQTNAQQAPSSLVVASPSEDMSLLDTDTQHDLKLTEQQVIESHNSTVASPPNSLVECCNQEDSAVRNAQIDSGVPSSSDVGQLKEDTKLNKDLSPDQAPAEKSPVKAELPNLDLFDIQRDDSVVKSKLKKRKKHKKKRRERAVVDGMEVEGIDRSCVFEPGSGDEESGRKQDDFVLKKLFKKTGVHSALKHDVIMNSADPDYILVETEANKVAQSAVRALKVSRRQIQAGSRWGRPTWTGNSGIAGAPGPSKPRFGSSSGSQGLKINKSKHFDGKDAGTSSSLSSQKGSLRTSSSVLLAKMRSRNATTAPTTNDGPRQADREVQPIDLHRDKHGQLLKDIRDFIATQCKVDGQASTSEILEMFSSRLPRSDTAVFRSLLNEICDFGRHLGDGLWSLKPEFR